MNWVISASLLKLAIPIHSWFTSSVQFTKWKYWMLCSLHFLSEKYPFCNHPVLIRPSSVAHFSNIFKHLTTYLSTSNVLLTYIFFTSILYIFHVFQACIEGVTFMALSYYFFILSCPCISLIYNKYSIFNILYILIWYINTLYGWTCSS